MCLPFNFSSFIAIIFSLFRQIYPPRTFTFAGLLYEYVIILQFWFVLILLSKLIGKPYPTYFQGITLPNYDRYENRLEGWFGHEYAMDLTESSRNSSSIQARESDNPDLDKEGIITFGYDRNAEIIPGKIKVSKRDLIAHQLNPERMGWTERIIDKKGRVSAKDIAEADRGRALTTTDVGGIKGFTKKLLDKLKGKGEK